MVLSRLRQLYPFILLALTVVAAFAVAMLICIPILNPPPDDVRLLFVFMVGTGSVTIGLVYLLHERRLLQKFNSLRWTLLAIIVITVLLIFINVWVTAQLMFISEHDLVLTTALLVFAGLIAIASVLVVSSALIERIHGLAEAARRLAQGDLKIRVSESGNDELAVLSRTFNHMAAALDELDERKRALEQGRRDLIAWVSHDLRTPLATVRAMNEALIDGVVTDTETVQRYQHNIQREIQHLSGLIDDLFALSQLDAGPEHFTLKREPTSLRDLVSDTLGSLSARARQREIRLSGSVDESIDMVSVAPDKIQRVLDNLLDNALHHTPPGGKVTLRARRCASGVEISVFNSGSSIAPDELPHIFESFYRGERWRGQGSDGYRGTGLGLAIARGLVEAHGGTIHADSDPARGTTFTFTLPLSEI